MGAMTTAPHAPGASAPSSDLSLRLGMLERDLRHSWASMLDVSTDAAARIGQAGRLIHRAKALLEDSSVLF
jgi:hypothetical protein